MQLPYNTGEFLSLSEKLAQAGRRIYQRGWSPATSSNYSVRINDSCCAITVSGKNKGMLTAEDIMSVDLEGNPLTDQKPSAETLLHTSLYKKFATIGSVLHTHSRAATVLTMLLEKQTTITLSGYELLKAFSGNTTHECSIVVPVFENTQDIAALAKDVEAYMEQHGTGIAYLIRGHGLYTWGETLDDCERHLEAMEFLLACELDKLKIGGRS